MEQHRYSSCSIGIHINTCSLASPYAYFTRSSDMLTNHCHMGCMQRAQCLSICQASNGASSRLHDAATKFHRISRGKRTT